MIQRQIADPIGMNSHWLARIQQSGVLIGMGTTTKPAEEVPPVSLNARFPKPKRALLGSESDPG